MKKILAMILACLMAVGLFSTVAFAEDYEYDAEGVAVEEQAYVCDAAETVVRVNITDATGAQVKSKAYSLTDLQTLGAASTNQPYRYTKNDTANLIGVTGYVTIDALIADAGEGAYAYEAGDLIIGTEMSSGRKSEYTKCQYAYEDFASGLKYFTSDTDPGTEVPFALAYCWAKSTTKTLTELYAEASTANGLMIVAGEKTYGTAAGKQFMGNPVEITLRKPMTETVLTVKSADTTGETVLSSKTYTKAELMALNGKTDTYYRMQAKGKNQVLATDGYVTIAALLENAGITLEESGRIFVKDSTGVYKKFDYNYNELTKELYFFESEAAEGTIVPAALAYKWSTGITSDTTTLTDIINKTYDSGNLRMCIGEAEYATAPGAEFANSVKELIVCKGFTDVQADDWFQPSVLYVSFNGLMTGVGDKTAFDPAGLLTREMLAVILYRNAGEPEVEYKATYPDVPDGKWYTDACIWANDNGIITGYESGYFGVSDPLTREQFATILYRQADKPATSYDISDYADSGQVSTWALDAMKWAVENGIITGEGGQMILNPQGKASRAVGATILQRYFESIS